MGKDREKVDGVAKSIIFVSSDSKQVSNYGIVNCQRRGLGDIWGIQGGWP